MNARAGSGSDQGGLPAGERVVRHLLRGIVNARFAPGQRLIEAELTAELGVSRGPVREAFRRLAAEGLVEVVPNRGAVVRRLSKRETVELFQVRTELEALAARLAAGRVADPSVRSAFERDAASIWREEPRVSVQAYNLENRRFHEALFTAAGNGELVAINRRLQLPLIMFRASAALTPVSLSDSVTEHRTIAASVLNGDAAAADSAIRAHLARAAALLETAPDAPMELTEGLVT